MSDYLKDMFIDIESKKNKEPVSELTEVLQLIESLGVLSEREKRPSIEKQDDSEGEYFLPTIRISEAWGRPGNKDRQIIEKFARTIGGDTLEQKIVNINRVITEADEDAGIPQILSSMVMIEILNAILVDFTESAGGFIFEGFLAGLFGKDSVQITDTDDQEQESGATGKPITDVVLGGKEYSLKLLGQTTGVKGSFRNMVEHFKGRDHIIYLDARRTGDGLEFGEFKITLENFDEVFIDPFLKQVTAKKENISSPTELKQALSDHGQTLKGIRFSKKFPGTNAGLFTYSPKLDEIKVSANDLNSIMRAVQEMPDEELEALGPFTISYADAKFEGTKAEKLFGTLGKAEQIRRLAKEGNRIALLQALEETPGYQEREQFEFTRNQAENIVNFQQIGELKINPEILKRTWLAYGDVLKQSVEPIYKSLNSFTKNINSFFLTDEEEGNHKQHGVAAAGDAMRLQTSTDKAVKDIK